MEERSDEGWEGHSKKEWQLREKIVSQMLKVPAYKLEDCHRKVHEYDQEIYFEFEGGLSAKVYHEHDSLHDWKGDLIIYLDGREVCKFEGAVDIVEKVFKKYYSYLENEEQKKREKESVTKKSQREKDLTRIESLLERITK